MKFTPSPIAGQMSGSAGSLVASRNRFGSYFRTKVSPVNPNTLRQQTMRTIFTTLVNAWIDELDAAERTAWKTYADNVPINGEILTGQNHYIRANSIRLQIDEPRIDAAPVIFDTGAPVTSIEITTDATLNVFGVNLAIDALAIDANIDATASEDGDVVLYMGAPINLTRNFFKGPYQFAASAPVVAAQPQGIFAQLFTVLESDNGDPAVGQNRPIRIRVMYDDGRLSDSFELLSVVEADSA